MYLPMLDTIQPVVPVLHWHGIERIAMILFGINDIRHLYENDQRFQTSRASSRATTRKAQVIFQLYLLHTGKFQPSCCR